MRYRKLGRTGIDIGIVGLGAESLEHASRDTITSVVNEAIDHGANYIDLCMASPDVRDNFGIAVKNSRNKVIVAGHLGPTLINGQYSKSRNNEVCEKYFDDLLVRLQTNYIDILMLHFVDEPDDYEKVFNPGGLLQLAIRLKKEGKARFIGMSSHKAPVALKAVNSGHIDVLMFSINPAADTLPGDIRLKNVLKKNLYNLSTGPEDESTLERKKLYHTCAIQEVGLVAMKPYAGGVLFRENPSSIILTPVQCINYALSQPGVCTVVPGCKNVTEMKAALAFLDATDDEKDYSTINVNSIWKLRGSCMYCNHCLPCPVGIDIGTIIRLTDTAIYGSVENIALEYEILLSKASHCTECGVCMERCPFGVDVVANITRAVEIFGK